MKPGDLRYRGTLKQIAVDANGDPLTDSSGEPTGEMTDFATVWCSIEPLRGREYFAADQVNSEVDTRIRIRYLDGVNPKMIFSSGSHTFDVLSVIHTEFGKRELQLMCKERL